MKGKGITLCCILLSAILSGCLQDNDVENKLPICDLPPISYPAGNAPYNITLSIDAYDLDGQIVSWSLDMNNDSVSEFNGNDTSLPALINYTYHSAGTYTMKFTVIDNKDAKKTCTATVIILNPLENNPPLCSLSADPNTGSAPQLVTFHMSGSDLDGSIVTWQLDIDSDGIVDYSGLGSPPPTQHHTYQNTGTYSAKLTVTDNEGATTNNITTINIIDFEQNQPPTCLLSANPTSGYVPLTVNFSMSADDSDGSISSWKLDIDSDGFAEYSGYGNPLSTRTHIYVHDGTYTAKLTVKDNEEATAFDTIIITVLNNPPVATFNYIQISPYSHELIQFFDVSTDSDGSITSWYWDFDDGNTSTAENPTHTYYDDGLYTVSLTVRDDEGATNSTYKTITVLNVPPIANYTYFPQYPKETDIIQFNDISTDMDGIVVNWTWDFDDGNISYKQNPTHQYGKDGIYYVFLTVRDDDGGTALDIAKITITPTANIPPDANFSYNPLYPSTDDIIQFTDFSIDSDGSITSWFWELGDGNTSTIQNITHRYANNGTYIVNLTVWDDYGDNDTSTQQITVTSVSGNYFSIACWNLQVFGPTKASNDTLLTYYADKLDDYDLFIVQEIRDASGTAIVALADKLQEYSYILSERAGTTSSKEQYAIFYNNKATLISQYDYTPSYQHEFERPPFKATFTVNNWTFTLYTIHTKPDNVPNELTNLENLTGTPSSDTIIIGDLNADGSYYNEDIIAHFTNWSWVITNDMDTTVATSDNTYDRIIINTETNNNLLSVGVMDDVNSDQSDHYLVYAVFDANSP